MKLLLLLWTFGQGCRSSSLFLALQWNSAPPQPPLSTIVSLYSVENLSQATPSLSLGTLSIHLLPGQPKCGVSHGKDLGQALGLRSFHPGTAIKAHVWKSLPFYSEKKSKKGNRKTKDRELGGVSVKWLNWIWALQLPFWKTELSFLHICENMHSI